LSARQLLPHHQRMRLRVATFADRGAIERVMKESAKELGAAFYDPHQTAGFVTHVANPDPQLVEDGTYFVVEAPGGEVAGCGGWSRRDKLFSGNDQMAGGARLLVPPEPARVRAMFVAPAFARQGLGRQILDACEAAACAEQFTHVELMATLPGVPLYRACGYIDQQTVDVALPDGVVLRCIRMAKPLDDVPIRVDFRDAATARTWIEETRIKRPYRPRFFAAFCAALAHEQLRILELGSGPGQLAREILLHCDVATYVALDFSSAMHAIAAEHLGDLADRVTFVRRDFREPTWPRGLGEFDAVVTLQAAHETRHERHLEPLLARARMLLGRDGVLLYADHYQTPQSIPNLLPARAAQPLALRNAGFSAVELLYEESTMALWRGR
jgi:SAM-dependent methyltransferase/GNAT superfamily N-acetyltransferase